MGRGAGSFSTTGTGFGTGAGFGTGVGTGAGAAALGASGEPGSILPLYARIFCVAVMYSLKSSTWSVIAARRMVASKESKVLFNESGLVSSCPLPGETGIVSVSTRSFTMGRLTGEVIAFNAAAGFEWSIWRRTSRR